MKTNRLALAVTVLFAFTTGSALALTVPVAEDTYSTATGKLTPATGKSMSLAVNAKQTAFIRFNLSDPAVVPSAIVPGNIVSATLRIFVESVRNPDNLTVHAITSAWTENPVTASAPEPAVDATVLATIPGVALQKDHFVSVDVTAAVQAALGVNDFGFALETTSGAKVFFASKEGPALGYAAELEIEANLEGATSGDLSGDNETLIGNLTLAVTTGTTGIIYAGNNPFLHDFGYGDFFGGLGAGNFTLTGNSNSAVGFQALSADTTGSYNAALGYQALHANQGGIYNTATGYLALTANTSGFSNTATGAGALQANTMGNQNTAGSDDALAANTTGSNNTATGYAALFDNQTGSNNTATGVAALYSNTADNNTATGYFALYSNTSGTGNLAEGYESLYSNTVGAGNVAEGYQSLYSNISGFSNTAIGFDALYSNLSGAHNTAVGYQSLYANGNGQPQFSQDNAGFGYQALYANTTGSRNTAVGSQALAFNTTGNNNIAIGNGAGGGIVNGTGNIMLNAVGSDSDNFTTRIGEQNIQTSAYFGGIYGSPSGQIGATVLVDLNGKLFTAGSSRRFKQDILPMDDASDVLLQLHPVTFRYKAEFGSPEIPQFGLIAEEVNEVCPELVAHDAKGGIYTVRYDAVNAMLLNEFLKEHQRVEEQERRLAEQAKEIGTLTTRLEKIERQLEMLGKSSN